MCMHVIHALAPTSPERAGPVCMLDGVSRRTLHLRLEAVTLAPHPRVHRTPFPGIP